VGLPQQVCVQSLDASKAVLVMGYFLFTMPSTCNCCEQAATMKMNNNDGHGGLLLSALFVIT
jgi:hypothetical protein